jgi:MoaA/NifB/PqqE/SkfB family radical SAM enzyme
LQFQRLAGIDEMRRAFKQAVNKVEIETSSQCNRRCTYCPNSRAELHHRRETNSFMDMEMFKRLLRDLREIDYDKKIGLVGMNEFFMHEENFTYLELVKAALPKSTVWVYSNGDYVTRALLERAERAGLDRLLVSFHLAPGTPFNSADVLDRATKFMKATGVDLKLTEYKPGERIHSEAKLGRLTILAGLVNWETAGHNWAGAVDSNGKGGVDPSIPCQAPVSTVTLCHNGDFALCCVVPRERTPQTERDHSILGNLADFPSLFHAYASDAMLWWRQHAFSTKQVPELCRNCSGRNWIGNTLNKPLAAYAEDRHSAIRPPWFKADAA